MSSNKPSPPDTPAGSTDAGRQSGANVRTPAALGQGLHIKGSITGHEDLHVDGKVEGPIALGGHRLTVGRTGQVISEIVAREVIVYGNVDGDLTARDRIEIKKDGSVVGDLSTARIVIEDGAYFKGHIEIDKSHTQVGTDLDTLLSRTTPKS